MGDIEDYINSESSFKSILLLFDWTNWLLVHTHWWMVTT